MFISPFFHPAAVPLWEKADEFFRQAAATSDAEDRRYLLSLAADEQRAAWEAAQRPR